MPRTRLLELLTAAGLADKDLERERIKAQRDAGIANSWVSGLTNVGKSAVDAVGAVGAASEKSAKTDAEALLASNAGVTGAEAPAPMAAPADRSKLAALDDVVEYQPPPKDFVTVRAPSATTDLSAAATYKPTPSPLEAAKEPLRTPVPRSPFSALIYSKTPGEEAASITAAGLKPSDNAFADLLSGNARKEVAANTQKALAAQIVANRAAAQGRADTVDTRTQAAQWHNQDTGLKIAGLNQAERHFGTKLEADAAAQQAGFKNAKEMQKAGFGNAATLQGAGFTHDDAKTEKGQAFTADQNDKRNATTTTNAQILAGAKVTAAEKAAAERLVQSGDVKDIAGYDTTLKLLDRIEKSKEGVDSGPVEALKPDALLSPAQLALKADIGSLVAAYIQSISGAGVSNEERASLLKNVPNFTDSNGDFKTKLVAMRTRLQAERTSRTGALGSAGFKVDGFKEKPTRAQRIQQLIDAGSTPEQVQATLAAEEL